jgi:hypothetical protein
LQQEFYLSCKTIYPFCKLVADNWTTFRGDFTPQPISAAIVNLRRDNVIPFVEWAHSGIKVVIEGTKTNWIMLTKL